MLNTVRIGLVLWLAAAASPGYGADAACPPAPRQPAPEVLQSAMRNAQDHGYLWRISRDGGSSYLYGTMHVGKPEWMFPGPKVMAALRAADTVALELDVLDPEILARTRKGMAASHGAVLPEPLVQRLRQQAKALCVPYDTLAKAAPELQVTMLGIVAARWEGLDAGFAADAMLASLGHAGKKNMVSLETPESQLQALLMTTPQETAAFVEDSLEELESSRARQLLRRQALAWANADYAEMDHYADWCDCLRNDIEREMMKRMLDERNPAMAERIDALHQSGKRVFAAVGSLHLFGPQGLPALLAKRGYQVERIDLRPEGRKPAHKGGAT